MNIGKYKVKHLPFIKNTSLINNNIYKEYYSIQEPIYKFRPIMARPV